MKTGRKNNNSGFSLVELVIVIAIMAVLVVYCLKDAFANPVKTGIPQGIGVLVVAASYNWKKNTLLSIFLGTAAVMLAMRLI